MGFNSGFKGLTTIDAQFRTFPLLLSEGTMWNEQILRLLHYRPVLATTSNKL